MFADDGVAIVQSFAEDGEPFVLECRLALRSAPEQGGRGGFAGAVDLRRQDFPRAVVVRSFSSSSNAATDSGSVSTQPASSSIASPRAFELSPFMLFRSLVRSAAVVLAGVTSAGVFFSVAAGGGAFVPHPQTRSKNEAARRNWRMTYRVRGRVVFLHANRQPSSREHETGHGFNHFFC